MEPVTGLAILGSALSSAKLAEKILGPTAAYVGDGLKAWTEKRVQNVARIFESAHRRLGDRVEEPGVVPPRVLKEILEDGPYCEDALFAEYFGGVLASSRTPVSRDDRGTAFAATVTRLSTYQLRCHYLLYTLFKSLFDGSEHVVNTNSGRTNLEMFVPLNAFHVGMDFSADESMDVLIGHCIVGLVGEDLLDSNYKFGSSDFLKQNGYADAPGGGLVVQPSMFGVELFHWAHGLGNIATGEFLRPPNRFESPVNVTITPGVRSTRANGPSLDERLVGKQPPEGPA